jgi:intracellular sulfur oxidation DsrE/DsrF family protein
MDLFVSSNMFNFNSGMTIYFPNLNPIKPIVMKNIDLNEKTHRRGFLGLLTGGAAALGLTALASPFMVHAERKEVFTSDKKSDLDMWFDKIKGSHRVVYDSPHPHLIFPFAWPRVFLISNEKTGTPASDCGVMVVLRHESICYAMKDEMWAKYNFAEVFKAQDPGPTFQAADAAVATKTRNPFWNTKSGDFKVPGIGVVEIGIKELQASGVLFCVCSAAMNVYSTVLGGKMSMNPDDILKEWNEHLIPGIQPVPSGVWALGRAQEHKCSYIFAG